MKLETMKDGQNLPVAKKARLEVKESVPLEVSYCQKLLAINPEKSIPPSILQGGKTQNSLDKLRTVLENHGFRISMVASPRRAISVYKDSCTLGEHANDGKFFLVTMLGLHPNQTQMERFYTTTFKKLYCLILFCRRIREACRGAMQDDAFASFVTENEQVCRSLLAFMTDQSIELLDKAHTLSSSVPKRVASLIQWVVKAEPRSYRVEQLEQEYSRIKLWNSTLSNALVTLFMQEHDCCIKDIFFKGSHLPQFERLTLYLYDPELDHHKPPHFVFMPHVKMALENGPEAVVDVMIRSFWSHLLREGYFATEEMKQNLKLSLEKFFLSGIRDNAKVPLQLNAHFTPTWPLSFYLYGKAGSGKSSFVRKFQPALEATIEEHVDPEILARFVKQNLNKPVNILELELELRPNNNDLSVMSIIQGRRMTMKQTKPGLVVVDLEEMPSNGGTNPNQLKVSQLISQRFSGRKGSYQEAGQMPRNSDKRGIGDDSSLITLFTSNYVLEEPSLNALQRVKMFQNLARVEMVAVSGPDRIHFASLYLQQCVNDRFEELNPTCHFQLDISVGDGDTRPLVRRLRMLSFYISALVADTMTMGMRIEASISQKGLQFLVAANGKSVELTARNLDTLVPLTGRVFDSRAKQAMDQLHLHFSEHDSLHDLSIIFNFWLAKTLTPAVILSSDEAKIKKIVEVLGELNGIHSIRHVNPDRYKMMKSLYDKKDTPNLRDDILKFGDGSLVAVEIRCESKDAQLCIREIIEDSPSMTAFSTAKSALHKSGLLFAVYVAGSITPEITSRASIIL